MTTTTLDTTGLLAPQVPHAIKLLNSLFLNGVAADLSETGVGKTYCASWIAKQFNAPIVVICPKAVIPTWNKVLAIFGVKASIICNYEKLLRGSTQHVSFAEPQKGKEHYRYQLVRAHFPAGALVILDEAHKCKGVSSLNAGLMIALKKQGYKTLSLSATQATSPIDMRAFGYMTNLHDLYHWKQWCLQNGAIELTRFNTFTFDGESREAQNKMAVCHFNLFNTQEIASRLTREAMGALFPENHINAQAFDLGSNDPKIKAVYDEMEQEIAKMDEQTGNYSAHVFAEIMKARRKAEMLKVPLFEEMIEDLYDEGKSITIFLNFTETIDALKSRLDKNTKFNGKIGLIHGDQTFKQRWADVDEFQADRKRILICNLRAGGVALSFHDLNGKYPRAALISPSFSAIDIMQALGRIHRQGGKTKCYQIIVFAAGCIEERACERIQAKLNNLSQLNDGDLTAGFKLF